MALDADILIDRMHLKSQVARWRLIAIVTACSALALYFGDFSDITPIPQSHVAEITIEGVIHDDPYQQDLLEELRENSHAKAVIVRIDSPGGTVVGGEELYLGLRAIAKEKPVVIVMRSLCTSAGYMAALGGDYLIAREGTITGSIGVIMQTMEVTKLADTLGIKPITIKSGEQKAAPNPFEPMTQGQRQLSQEVVSAFFEYFISLVKKRRNLSPETIATLSDGRIVTGRQALEMGLIDRIGGDKQARHWLEKKHQIDSDMDVVEYEPDYPAEPWLGEMSTRIRQLFFSIENLSVTLDGLTSIWQPSVH